MHKFDLLIVLFSNTILLINGGVIPLIASIFSIIWVLIRFLHYIDVSHNKSFKTFFKWGASWLKKN